MKPSGLPLVPLPSWMLEINQVGWRRDECRHGVSPTARLQPARPCGLARKRARGAEQGVYHAITGLKWREEMRPRNVIILDAAREWHPLALCVSHGTVDE